MQIANRKIMTIVGTRPELIKLSRVICELDKRTSHVLVHTGQNFDYELNEIFYKDLGIRKPDYYLDTAAETPIATIANVLVKVDGLLDEIKPDAIVLYGDTNSCLCVISAKRRKIPVFHMEAGNRCFDQRVPEELNRKVVDHLSDINLTLTEHARRYLLAEGLAAETVFKVGSSMPEVLAYCKEAIQESDVLERLGVARGSYFIVSVHREENIDSADNFSNLLRMLKAINSHFGKKVIVSTHPRTRKKLENANEAFSEEIQFLRPLGFVDYIKLQMNAFCVVSDSGTITEESSILKFPAVTVRQAHERPEGMDEGTLIMCGVDPERVIEAIAVVTAQAEDRVEFRTVPDYAVDNLSSKVVRIIMSYIDYVNRCVWSK